MKRPKVIVPRSSRRTRSAQGGRESAEKPLYARIVEILQREVVLGKYPVGAALPSEAVLAERFAVSRHTVREALRILRESGLVMSRQGLGTIVRHPGRGRGYVHEVNSISDLFPAGVETRYEPASGTLLPLPASSGLQRELDDQPRWLRIQATRRQRGDALPFNELDAYVAARFAGVARVVDDHSGPIYGLIEALYGESMGEVEQIFGAFESDGVLGAALGMGAGDIGIEIRRIYRLSSDRDVAMVSFNRYCPEAFSFSMTLRKIRE